MSHEFEPGPVDTGICQYRTDGKICLLRWDAPVHREEKSLGLSWGENKLRELGVTHVEWHAPCGCAFHPKPFPHIHPCSDEHKRPDLHALTET